MASKTGPGQLRKEWFRITREFFAHTIADVDLGSAALAQVEQAFI